RSSPLRSRAAPAIRIVNKSSYEEVFLRHNVTAPVPVQCYIESDCMRSLSRVVWSEGMYLGPHHFQVQGRYFEDSIRFATSSLWYKSYGLIGGQFDPQALRNGIVSLLHARGMFPDGLTFHMPESDPLPEARNIADLFPVKRDKVTILLTVPPRRPEGLNCITADADASVRNGEAPRFYAEPKLLHDETTGRDEKPVQVGRKNIQ